MTKVLTINTYAGSLLLGARAFGAEIIGSFEDGGFGQHVARANFPDVEHVKDVPYWPHDLDLRDVVVLAHPPCSAFSVQNSSWNARGTNAAAFQCTRRVLDYATTRHAAAIAIESVVGALGGAWEVHQSYAKNYNLYRILQNGCAFGPQWRERFWVVYVRKDLAPTTMRWRLRPTWTRVAERVDPYLNDPSMPVLDRCLAKLKHDLSANGITEEQLAYLLNEQDPPHRTTGILKIIHETYFKDTEWRIEDLARKFDMLFSSSQLCYLDPTGLAGTLLGVTWWYYRGRNLSANGYKRIMGFPADYVFPAAQEQMMRSFLSKGVVPQVATWILCNVARHVGMTSQHACHACGDGPAYELEIEPNHIADFRFKRTRWMKEELPQLRHFYEPEEWEEESA